MRYVTDPIETIERGGLQFAVRHEPDDSGTLPWEDDDGVGSVRQTRWNYYDRPAKYPGERVLLNDRGSALLYDFAGTVKRARADGWRPRESTLARLRETKGRELTPGEIAAAAVEEDFDRLRRFVNDDWGYIGVVVTLLDAEGDETGEVESLWGIESDSGDYLGETAVELADEIVARVGDAAVLTTRVRATTIEHRLR